MALSWSVNQKPHQFLQFAQQKMSQKLYKVFISVIDYLSLLSILIICMSYFVVNIILIGFIKTNLKINCIAKANYTSVKLVNNVRNNFTMNFVKLSVPFSKLQAFKIHTRILCHILYYTYLIYIIISMHAQCLHNDYGMGSYEFNLLIKLLLVLYFVFINWFRNRKYNVVIPMIFFLLL